jgi:hypothetical protein
MTDTIKLTSPQRKALIALAAGEATFRKGAVLSRLCTMGLVEYVPERPENPSSMRVPRITDAGMDAINDGPEILKEMLECRKA